MRWAFLAAATALLFFVLFFGGGSSNGRLFWIGVLALVAVGALAVAAWLALGIARRESLAALAIAVPAALVVSGIALALPGVVHDFQPESVRVRDGAWFGLALVAGAAAVGVVARRGFGRKSLRA